MKGLYYLSLLFVFYFTFISCKEERIILPKPRMYPKVNYPNKDYQIFDTTYCNLRFEYPKYATIKQDNNFFGEQTESDCWFNIEYQPLNGTLFCSYMDVQNRKHFDKLVADAFKMAEEHNKKANYRKEEFIKNKNGVSGIYFDIGGDTATNLQFFLSDTTQHFFRGSLYFNAKVDSDSIAPIFDFVKKDVEHMLTTFEWKK